MIKPSLLSSNDTSAVPAIFGGFPFVSPAFLLEAIVKMIEISRASKQEKDDALKESKAGPGHPC